MLSNKAFPRLQFAMVIPQLEVYICVRYEKFSPENCGLVHVHWGITEQRNSETKHQNTMHDATIH